MIILQQFKQKISELLNKEDPVLLAARHTSSLQQQISDRDTEIRILHYTLQEVCKYAFMIEGTAESKDPQHWIEVIKKRYGYDI